MSGPLWFAEGAERCLSARFGGPVRLDPPEVDWDRRAVCRAELPDGRRAVVKIDTDEVRHRRESAGLLAAADAGAPVPRVLWHGRDGFWFLVLEEVPTRRSMADGGGPWRAAGAAARALHDTPVPPGLAMFCDGVGEWEQHVDHRVAVECAEAARRGLLTEAESDAVRRYALRLLAEAGPAPRALVHGDLQARHLLVDGGQVVLVDFGDVGWGDPVLDLVVLTHFEPEHRAEVLDGYRADAALRARVALLAPLYSLWRNLFVSRWYHENEFEQRRNTETARRVLETEVLPSARVRSVRLECDAALLDFDGLLIDTEYAGWRSWNELYARYGRALDATSWALRAGGDDPLSPWEELEGFAGAPLDREGLEQARRVSRDGMLTVLPGVRRFLERCWADGITLCLVSNSPMKWIQRQMSALGLDPDVFDLIVPGGEHPAKPAPDGYLLALAKLGVAPERAVAFEDSARGVSAAKAAGLRCVAVPNRITAHNDFSHADLVVGGLDEVAAVSRSGVRS
ncbi:MULTISPECIES: HAD-IA family hydrolase [Actinosynnema]|uniref:HAD-IA family hydrolase n=1 Tax=Actinosynnema TaxID=40566 RepID=UPI0020A28BEE|nr:HAD-IA family hydrolase [Actinosynnema pretiosum]MCP2097745.1 haloacid dehalogenase superfamily, subfamily IA, variant 3 with third motif having DD or ED [Actinosynnema pretiosum]